MSFRIFYCWQSDLPNPTNRGFIEKALESAAKAISKDDSVDVQPDIDRDTLGIPGAPDIASTILAKIAQSQAFVCDLTIINREVSQDADKKVRLVPNPNVLIELGYALAVLGWERTILVFNTAFGRVEELPFDLRNKRVIDYHMPLEATDRANERQALTRKLENALLTIIATLPPDKPKADFNSITQAAQYGELAEAVSEGRWSQVLGLSVGLEAHPNVADWIATARVEQDRLNLLAQAAIQAKAVRDQAGFIKAVRSMGLNAPATLVEQSLQAWGRVHIEVSEPIDIHAGAITAIAISHDSKRALIGSEDGSITLWDFEAKKNTISFEGDTPIYILIAAPEEDCYLKNGREGKVHLACITHQAYDELRTYDRSTKAALTSVAVTPDGEYLVTGYEDGTILVWGYSSEQIVRKYVKHVGAINALAVTPDSQFLLSGSEEGSLRVWSLTQDDESPAYDSSATRVHRAVRTLPDVYTGIMDIAITPDGRYAVVGTDGRRVMRVDLRSYQMDELSSDTIDYVDVVAISPDGQQVIIHDELTTLAVLDIHSGSELRVLPPPAFRHRRSNNILNHDIKVFRVAPDGRTIVAGSESGMVCAWHLPAGLLTN